jgi:serine protease Do
MPMGEIRQPIEEIISGKFTAKKSGDGTDSPAVENPHRYAAADFGIVMIPDVVARTPAFIERVMPGSSAAESGLRSNDLVLFVGDELIQSVRILKDELGRLEAGGKLRIVVRRADQLVTVELPIPRKEIE